MCPPWCMAFRDEAVTCWIDSATTSIPVEEYAALERVTGVAGRGDDPTGTNWAIRNAERDYARGRPCKRVLSASDSHTPRGRPRPASVCLYQLTRTPKRMTRGAMMLEMLF